MEGRCRRCGGELRQAAILANYKSFVVSLMRCAECGATVERKENAHRPGEQVRRRLRGSESRDRPLAAGRHTPEHLIPDPEQAPPAPTPEPPRRRLKRARKIERPFNVRVTKRR